MFYNDIPTKRSQCLRPEYIDFPVSYDWAIFYNREHGFGQDLPQIDDRLPWQREEARRLDRVIARAAREPYPDDIPPLNDTEYAELVEKNRITFLENKVRKLETIVYQLSNQNKSPEPTTTRRGVSLNVRS